MDINVKVNSNLRIRAFYLFFIMGGVQIGVGIIGASKYVFLDARQDSWISILIAYVAMLLVLWAMLLILRSYDNTDIFGIQVDVFGKWIGTFFSTIYILHFAFSLLVVLVTYMEIVHLFIFPQMNTWVMGFLLLSLTVYSIAGGLRSMVGVVLLFFFLSNGLLLLLYKPISLIEVLHYQPVLQASVPDLLKGAQSSILTFAGFEIIFLVYPFIQNQKQAWRPIFLGATWSAIVFLLTTVIAIGYFSDSQMQTIEWSTLSLFKTVTLPFIERFDVIVVAVWMTITLPTIMLLMWAVTRGMERVYRVPKRRTLYSTGFVIFIISGFIQEHHLIMTLNDKVNSYDLWLLFVYPFVLLLLVKLRKYWQCRQKRRKHT